jgi:type II secretory pathway pseudopilin PulG
MNSIIETIIVIAIIALAAGFMARRILKAMRGKKPPCCGGDT